jgi:hypothetical protein
MRPCGRELADSSSKTKRVIQKFARLPRPAPPRELVDLSERERDVFRLMARGLSKVKSEKSSSSATRRSRLLAARGLTPETKRTIPRRQSKERKGAAPPAVARSLADIGKRGHGEWDSDRQGTFNDSHAHRQPSCKRSKSRCTGEQRLRTCGKIPSHCSARATSVRHRSRCVPRLETGFSTGRTPPARGLPRPVHETHPGRSRVDDECPFKLRSCPHRGLPLDGAPSPPIPMTLWQLGQATRITRKPPRVEDATSVVSTRPTGASQCGQQGFSGIAEAW